VSATARRRRAVLAGHQGDVGAAHKALTDADAAVRAGALGALERLGQLDDDALIAALLDPAANVRRRAAQLAARHAEVSLLHALEDDDPSVVEMAAFASGEQQPPNPAAVRTLAALSSGHPDALVREAAIAALGAIGDATALPVIIAALDDKPAIRRRAVIALAPFSGPAVDQARARARTDRDWQVRQIAEDIDDSP
jgi:HEAT repeat protein